MGTTIGTNLLYGFIKLNSLDIVKEKLFVAIVATVSTVPISFGGNISKIGFSLFVYFADNSSIFKSDSQIFLLTEEI